MKHLALAACVLGAAFSAAHGEPLRLDLEGALALAAENNLTLRKGLVSLRTAELRAKNTWSQVLPDISASGGVGYSRTLFTEPSNPMANDNPLRYSADLSVSLQLNAGIPSAIRNIAAAYRSQELGFEAAYAQIRNQTAKAFYELITERMSLAVLEEEASLARRQLEKSEAAFRNGLAGERSVLQARLGVETAKLNLLKAQARLRNDQEIFLHLLGLEVGAEVELEGVLSVGPVPYDPEELVSRALASRTDVRSRRLAVESAENLAAQTTLSSRGPRVSLSASWSGSRTGESTDIVPFSDSISARVGVSIPLDAWIPGSKSALSIGAARADIEVARLDLRNLEAQAALDIRKFAAALEGARGNIEIAELRLRMAERSYTLADQAFQIGALERLEYEAARKDLTAARQQLLSEKLAYITATIDLAGALNMDVVELIGRTQ